MNRWIRVFYAFPAIAAAGSLFYLSSLPDIKIPLEGIVSFNDLICHGAAYFIFGISLMIAAHPSETFHTRPASIYALLIAIGMLFAMSDEIHQAFVPNRTCSFLDFLADTFGLALALSVRHALWRSPKFNRLLKCSAVPVSHQVKDQ